MADQRTVAEIEVGLPGQPSVVIDEIKEFDYSSDVLAVGDEQHFTVLLDERGDRIRDLRGGSTVRLYLRNPAVNGGSRTLKHLGILTEVEASPKTGEIRCTSADLGWHLTHCHAPLWRSLRHATYQDLCDPDGPHTFLERSFGFRGLRSGKGVNALNRGLKLGRQVAAIAANRVIDPVYAIQIEAGDSYFDTMSRYAQRINLLVGVTVDGYIQIWNPDYDREPAYRFNVSRTESNVEDLVWRTTIDSVYTEVVCVGETTGYQGSQDPNDPNASHRRGAFRNPAALPFTHRLTFGDGEMWSTAYARKQAEWRYKRGQFDSHYLIVTILDHHQGGQWLESDQMVRVTCPELGLQDASYYVASVVCESRVQGGDRAHLCLRLPYLLSASWGEWRTPPAGQAEITVKLQGAPAP